MRGFSADSADAPNDGSGSTASQMMERVAGGRFCGLKAALRAYTSTFHFAWRSTARGEPFITSYHTLTSEPSSSSTVLG